MRLEFHKNSENYGWEITLFIRGKHRVRYCSPKATTPGMRWHFFNGGDENCNRATSLYAYPLGMIDVWWEPNWRPAGSGMCDACKKEMED